MGIRQIMKRRKHLLRITVEIPKNGMEKDEIGSYLFTMCNVVFDKK